jgi:hypothetical protein
MMFVTCRKHTYGSMACYGHSFTFLYIDDVRISQETSLWASMACYGNCFTVLYADDVRNSEETQLYTSTVC